MLDCIKRERPEKFGKYEKQLTSADNAEGTVLDQVERKTDELEAVFQSVRTPDRAGEAMPGQMTDASADIHPPIAARIFLSYAREDETVVRELYRTLLDAGHQPWMDTQKILPGERWEDSIRRAIKEADFFLACMSTHSVNKRGVLQKEIRSALDTWQGMLDSDIYLVPVRLQPCLVPDDLSGFQWVDLFAEDGREKLFRAIREGLRRRDS